MGNIPDQNEAPIPNQREKYKHKMTEKFQEIHQNSFSANICDGVKPFQNLTDIHVSTKQKNYQTEDSEFLDSSTIGTNSHKENAKNCGQIIEGYPFSCIGEIRGRVGESYQKGSGCLIGPNIVLTCAHNIYSRKDKQERKNVEFYLQSQKQPKKVNIKKFYFPEEYEQQKEETIFNYPLRQSYDYACLELEEKCENYGYLGVDFSENSCLEQKIMIVGYPENHSQKKIKGKVCQANDQMLYYEIKRQAKIGGMIIAERNGKFYVIGLHKENNPSSQKSVGLRLTPEKRERLNSWIGNLALKLENRYLGDEAMEALLQKRVEKVQTLRLNHNNLTSKGMKILATKQWINLTSFSLNGNKIGDEGIKELQHFPSIKELSLSKCGITSVGVSRLQEFSLPSLERLVLNGNQIGNEGMTALVPFCKQLKELHLWNCGITSNGLKLLSKGCFMLLERFVLSLNDIKDQGVEFLNKFLQLITLEFAYTSITELGVEKLVELPFERLKELWLNGDEIGEDGRIIADQYGRMQKINIKYC